MKETKDKIRVDFDRTPLKERLKAKFINSYFVKNVVFKLFRFLFLLGIAYVVLYPFITKISSSFMSPDDFVDTTVMLIPKEFTLDTYKAIWTELNFFDSIKHTFIISFTCAILQTFFCAFIAYGFAKYKFKGNGILFLVVILTMIIPHFVLSEAMMNFFGNFNPYGIVSLLTGGGSALPAEWQGTGLGNGLKLTMTWIPLVILSVTGLGFKNGLYASSVLQGHSRLA